MAPERQISRRRKAIALVAATALARATFVHGSCPQHSLDSWLAFVNGPLSLQKTNLANSQLRYETFQAGRSPGSNSDTSEFFGAFTACAFATLSALCVALPLALSAEPAYARPRVSGSGARVNKDPLSLLQYALPLEDALRPDQVQPVRRLQATVQDFSKEVELRSWGQLSENIKQVIEVISAQDIFKPVPAEKTPLLKAALQDYTADLKALKKDVDTLVPYLLNSQEDVEQNQKLVAKATSLEERFGKLEELLLPVGFKTPVPPELAAKYPQLQGRATVEIKICRGPDSKEQPFFQDLENGSEVKLKLIVDGYSNPITAGNFIEIASKGFYDGLGMRRADDFVVQSGDPGKAAGNGYKVNGKVRTIPLELGLKGRKEALYGQTLDEARMVGSEVKIPFQATGAVAMARIEDDTDSASSQYWFFIFESDMTPAGKNFIDGRYGMVGYVVENAEALRKVKLSDVVQYVKVVDGLENLVLPPA